MNFELGVLMLGIEDRRWRRRRRGTKLSRQVEVQHELKLSVKELRIFWEIY